MHNLTIPTAESIAWSLTTLGTLANPIQIISGVPGNAGFINLAPAGTQNISHVGVSDNWATGQPLAPLLTNEGGSGNSRGWFGILLSLPIPALGAGGIGLLALILASLGTCFAPRRRRVYERV